MDVAGAVWCPRDASHTSLDLRTKRCHHRRPLGVNIQVNRAEYDVLQERASAVVRLSMGSRGSSLVSVLTEVKPLTASDALRTLHAVCDNVLTEARGHVMPQRDAQQSAADAAVLATTIQAAVDAALVPFKQHFDAEFARVVAAVEASRSSVVQPQAPCRVAHGYMMPPYTAQSVQQHYAFPAAAVPYPPLPQVGRVCGSMRVADAVRRGAASSRVSCVRFTVFLLRECICL